MKRTSITKTILGLAILSTVTAVSVQATAHTGRHGTVGVGVLQQGANNYRLVVSFVDGGARDSGTIFLTRTHCGLYGPCPSLKATYRVLCAHTVDRSSSLAKRHHTQSLAVKVYGDRGLPKAIYVSVDDAETGDRVGLFFNPSSGVCSADGGPGVGAGSFQTVGFLSDP